MASSELSRRLSQPPLIRESSSPGSKSLFVGLLKRLRSLLCCCIRGVGDKAAGLKTTFDGVVLEDSLEQQLQFYAASIRNTRANRAPMRHMLFFGPPGTGKTLLVRDECVLPACRVSLMAT